MNTPTDAWENMFLSAGPEGILLVGFRQPELRSYTARRSARSPPSAARKRGRPRSTW